MVNVLLTESVTDSIRDLTVLVSGASSDAS